MTLLTRIALGVVTIAAILTVPLLIALRSLESLHVSTVRLRDGEFAASLLLGRIRAGTEELRRAETALLFVHDSASRHRMSEQLARVAAMADSLDQHALDSAARQLRLAVGEIGRYAPLEYAAALAGRSAEAESISTRHMVPAIGRVERWLTLAEYALRERMQARVAEAATVSERAQQLSAAALALALVATLLVGGWLAHSIGRPVRDLEEGMQAVADGQFGHQLTVAPFRRDEFGRLAASYQRMARQLDELDRLKAEFVSIASHELKTPLNVILGYLQLLQEGIYGPLTPKQLEVSHILGAQAESLARLVKQLLDISRFEAGGGRLEPRRIELARFLTDLETAFHVLAHQREVAFHVVRGPTLPTEVYWDPDRMNEVLGNLLSNAFKFTERGGTVRLSVEAVDHSIQMEVRDTGAGIPEAQLPNIFRKFYQADNQPAASHGGTGLGLAIAKEIVEAHAGIITVESTPGVGTTFMLILPTRAHGRRLSQPRALAESSAS